MSLTEKSCSQKQFLFLSQSPPFPAVTFCNFNAIKYSSLKAAKDTDRGFVYEVIEVELGKCSQLVFVHVSMIVRPGSYSNPGKTSRFGPYGSTY